MIASTDSQSWMRSLACATLLLSAAASTHAQATSGCGPLANHYGPFDYRTQRDKLKVVEDYHFTPEVEALIRGKSSSAVGGDLSYLMRTSPNHHRGLIALMRLAERTKTPQPLNVQYPLDCYFARAIQFAHDDTVVRVLYSQYLRKQGKPDLARQQLDTASELAKDNAFSHYNIGLGYFELGVFDRALAQAHKAKAMGFERQELADMLKRQNQWKDPEG